MSGDNHDEIIENIVKGDEVQANFKNLSISLISLLAKNNTDLNQKWDQIKWQFLNRTPESWLVEDLTSLLENLQEPHECENLCLFFPSLTLIEPTKLTELIEIVNFLSP